MTADSALRSAPAEPGDAPDGRALPAEPAFALTFDADSVHLMEREADAWVWRGAARFDAADLPGRMAALRRLLPPEAAGRVALIVPDDQILYTSVEVDPDLPRAEAVLRAMEGLTPYGVDELALDWRDEGGARVRVAAVWRQTLAEAEAFAARNGFVTAGLLADTDGRELPGGVHFAAGADADPRIDRVANATTAEPGVKGEEGGQSLAAELARTRPGAEAGKPGAEDDHDEPAAPVTDAEAGSAAVAAAGAEAAPPDADAGSETAAHEDLAAANAEAAPMVGSPAEDEATADVAASIARIRALSRRGPADAEGDAAATQVPAPAAPPTQGVEAQRDLARKRGKALGRQAERQAPPLRAKAVSAPATGPVPAVPGGRGLAAPVSRAEGDHAALAASEATTPTVSKEVVTQSAEADAMSGAAAPVPAGQTSAPGMTRSLARRPAGDPQARPRGHGGLAVMLALLAAGLLAVFLLGGDADQSATLPVAETTPVAPVQPAALQPAEKDEAAEVQPAMPAVSPQVAAPQPDPAASPARAGASPAPSAPAQPAAVMGLPQPPVPAEATVPPAALPPIGAVLAEPQAAPPAGVVQDASAPLQRSSAIETAIAEAVAAEPAATAPAPAQGQPAAAPETEAAPAPPAVPAEARPQVPVAPAEVGRPVSSARPIARPDRRAPAASVLDDRPQSSSSPSPARSPRPPAPEAPRGAVPPDAAPAAAPPSAPTTMPEAVPPAPRPEPAPAPEAAAPAPPPGAAPPALSRRPPPRPRQDAALLSPRRDGSVRLALAGGLTPAAAAHLRAFPVMSRAAARGALRIHGPSEAAVLRLAEAAAPLRLAQARPPRRDAGAPPSRSDAVEAAVGAAVAAAPPAATTASPLRGSSPRPIRRPASGGASAPAASLLSATAVEGAIAAAIEASPAPPGGVALSALRSSPLPPRPVRSETAPAATAPLDAAAEAAAASVMAAAPVPPVAPPLEDAAPDAQAAAQAERRRLDDELQAAVEARIRARAAADAKLEAEQRAAAEARARAQAAAEERAAAARRQPVRPAEIDEEPELAAAPRGGSTTATVAQNATHARGMNLNRTMLIGVVGAGPASRGLIRLRNGRIVTVRLGDRIDGGTITSIGNGRITYVKGSRPFELLMLDGR